MLNGVKLESYLQDAIALVQGTQVLMVFLYMAAIYMTKIAAACAKQRRVIN